MAHIAAYVSVHKLVSGAGTDHLTIARAAAVHEARRVIWMPRSDDTPAAAR